MKIGENLEERGSGRIQILCGNLPEWTEEIHENPQSE
jgi:hypothetical protein